jgi:hypothetical protein
MPNSSGKGTIQFPFLKFLIPSSFLRLLRLFAAEKIRWIRPIRGFSAPQIPLAECSTEARVETEQPCSGRRFFRRRRPMILGGELQPTTTMGDKNPKAKRKLQAQHELQKRLKAEEIQRHQRQIYESRHPEEPPNQEL